MVPLIVGTLLALAALTYVLWPLIVADGRRAQRTSPGEPAPDPGEVISPVPSRTDDPVEDEIRRARAQLRVCPKCGPRPEADARYCSSCGAALA